MHFPKKVRVRDKLLKFKNFLCIKADSKSISQVYFEIILYLDLSLLIRAPFILISLCHSIDE